MHDKEKLFDIVEVLVAVGEELGVSAAQVALAWTMHRPAITSVVIGARTDEQLADNLKAASLTLSEDQIKRLDEASKPPLLYPYWHQASTAAARLSPADRLLLAPFTEKP